MFLTALADGFDRNRIPRLKQFYDSEMRLWGISEMHSPGQVQYDCGIFRET
jgi:hypothetical protein